MGREKDRKLRRRQRRQKKLRKLKTMLAQARTVEERQFLEQKIRLISLDPRVDLPDSR